MSRNAYVGHVYLYLGDGGSPESFLPACEVFGLSGIGEASEQIDATDFCSGRNKEYIAGLADGSEITIEMNHIARADAAASMDIQRRMIALQKAGANADFQLRCDGDYDGITDLTFHFAATVLSWTFNPSPSAKNSISFGAKISGGIDITEP